MPVKPHTDKDFPRRRASISSGRFVGFGSRFPSGYHGLQTTGSSASTRAFGGGVRHSAFLEGMERKRSDPPKKVAWALAQVSRPAGTSPDSTRPALGLKPKLLSFWTPPPRSNPVTSPMQPGSIGEPTRSDRIPRAGRGARGRPKSLQTAPESHFVTDISRWTDTAPLSLPSAQMRHFVAITLLFRCPSPLFRCPSPLLRGASPLCWCPTPLLKCPAALLDRPAPCRAPEKR